MNVWINKVTGDALHRKLNSLTVITIFKDHYFSWIAHFQNLQNSELIKLESQTIQIIHFFSEQFSETHFKQLLTTLPPSFAVVM